MVEINFDSFLSLEAKRRQVSPLKSLLQYIRDDNVYLASGLPRVDSFPIKSLSFEMVDPMTNQLVEAKVSIPSIDPSSSLNLEQYQQYGTGLGNKELSQFYSTFIDKLHKPKYDKWSVVPSVGNTDSLYKCCLALLEKNQPVLVAEWAYPTALETFKAFGVNILPVQIDDEGILPESLDSVVEGWNTVNPDNRCKVVYTVPCGQNPTGATMSLERRHNFYRVSQKHNLLILEDDPYYFLQLDPTSNTDLAQLETNFPALVDKFGFGSLLPSLLSLDTDGRVIRFDTFSKILAPGLRSGFITAHQTLVEKLRFFNEVTVQQPSGYSQLILAKLFTETWRFDKLELHIAKLRLQFQSRLAQALQKLNQVNQPVQLFTNNKPVAGMFIWLKPNLKTGQKCTKAYMDSLFDKLVDSGVILVMGKFFDTKTFSAVKNNSNGDNGLGSPYIRLCFTYADLDRVLLGIDRLATTLEQLGCGQ